MQKLQLARDSRVVSTRVEELQSKVRAAEEKAVDAEAKLDEYKEEVCTLKKRQIETFPPRIVAEKTWRND